MLADRSRVEVHRASRLVECLVWTSRARQFATADEVTPTVPTNLEWVAAHGQGQEN